MRDLETLHTRLAREQAALSAVREEIEAAQRAIEALKAEIRAKETQITETERRIEELRARSETVERRIALLKEYIEMVQAGAEPPEAPAPAAAAEEPAPAAPAAPEGPEEPAQTEVELDELEVVEEESLELEEEVEELELVEELAPAGAPPAPEPAQGEPVTLENVDPQRLTLEILPRTETFGEELLLVLAYHRKAVAPKDVAKVFRRLEYAPKLSATEENVLAQIGADPHFYQSETHGKIGLTREGREAAQRLLDQLL